MGIDFIGSVLLAACGLPEAIRCYKNKRCDIGYGMLLSWLIGEVCLVFYSVETGQFVLLINYLANIMFISVMLYFKIFGSPA